MPSRLAALASGLIAPGNVSIHKAEEIGKKILEYMEGLNPLTLTLKKTDRVVQMPAVYSAKTVSSSIDSDLIFQRLVSVCTEAEVDEAFTFDLSHFPSSLFNDTGTLRTVTKALLQSSVGERYFLRGCCPMLPGICEEAFPDPEETFIISDGYLQPSTKDMVHGTRNPIASLEIDVAFDNVVDCKRELLLSNPKKQAQVHRLVDGRVRRRAISRKPVHSRC